MQPTEARESALAGVSGLESRPPASTTHHAAAPATARPNRRDRRGRRVTCSQVRAETPRTRVLDPSAGVKGTHGCMIARMGESGRYDYEGGGSVLARWQGIAASCALGLVLLAPAVISTPALAASGTPAPAADPHPVPTGLAPIPTVEDPVDAAEEDHPTDGKPPGKLV